MGKHNNHAFSAYNSAFNSDDDAMDGGLQYRLAQQQNVFKNKQIKEQEHTIRMHRLVLGSIAAGALALAAGYPMYRYLSPPKQNITGHLNKTAVVKPSPTITPTPMPQSSHSGAPVAEDEL